MNPRRTTFGGLRLPLIRERSSPRDAAQLRNPPHGRGLVGWPSPRSHIIRSLLTITFLSTATLVLLGLGANPTSLSCHFVPRRFFPSLLSAGLVIFFTGESRRLCGASTL